jgi:hypothetical protein
MIIDIQQKTPIAKDTDHDEIERSTIKDKGTTTQRRAS